MSLSQILGSGRSPFKWALYRPSSYTNNSDTIDISFLFELIERRYATKSTVLCTQYTPAEWHGRLGGGVQADAMVDCLVHESVRIDLGDVNVRKLLADRK